MTISASLKIAQTQPVIVAKTTASAWPGSCSRNCAIWVRKRKTSAIVTAARKVVHTTPTPSVYVGSTEACSADSSSPSTSSSSSSETPKVRIIVPGLESMWMSCVTRPVRKKRSA